MRLIALLIAAVLLSASTCARNSGGAGDGTDLTGGISTPRDGGSAIPPAQKQPVQIEIKSPKLPASESEIAGVWPDYIPPIEDSQNWEFMTAAKSDDGKHAGKAYLTTDSTHKVLEIFRTTLVARGFGAQQVEDPNYFGRMDFTDGETAIVVCVRHDNDKGKNAVEITVHKA